MSVSGTRLVISAQPLVSQLLAFHAVCARVTHMSGVTDSLIKLEVDAEETNVLASDESSVDLLSNLLSPCAPFMGRLMRYYPFT